MWHNCRYSDLVLAALSRPSAVPAFLFQDRAYSRKYIAARSFQTAHLLLQAGFKPGDGAVVLSRNHPDVFCAAASISLAGGRYTPLNSYSSFEDQRAVVTDSEAAWLLTDRPGADRAQALAGPDARVIVMNSDEAPSGAAAAPIAPPPGEAANADDIAVLAYTGGTTGRPKGVMLSHRALVTSVFVALAEWPWPDRPRFLLASPISHAAGALVLPTLLRGGTVVLHERFDPVAVLRSIQADRVTNLIAVPTMLYSLLDADPRRFYDTGSLEALIYGSAPALSQRLEQALERFGQILFQHYAQTEAPMSLTMLRKEEHDRSRPHLLRSCGRPNIGSQLALLDARGECVPEGQTGEIAARGPLIMSGYWKRPEETAAALENGWLHTGDIARRDEDGYLFIVGRRKDMIISGGFNVYPKEIEDVLAGHPCVSAAAVVGVPDPHWGERVVAFVVCSQEGTCDADVLKTYVRERKGAVLTPKQIQVVDALPLTPLGKVDKAALHTRC